MPSSGTRLTPEQKALDEIAGYVLPVYPIGTDKYVKVEIAEYLRSVAKTALQKSLKLKKKKGKK